MIKLRTKNNKKLAKQDNKRIYFQYIHSESILEKEYYAMDKDILLH